MLRLIKWLALFFIVILPILTIAVANRHNVQLVLDPFAPDNPALAIDMPLFVYIFVAVLSGLLIGGLATWFNQGKWRKRFRQQALEANQWRKQNDQLRRQLDAAQQPQLPHTSSNH